VGAYLRVSTDEQAESGLGLGDQRYRAAAMAAAKGWPAPVEYSDEGISGTKDASERPALSRLLVDAQAGQLDAVIVLSLDRLGRKTSIVLDLVEELTRQHVTLVSCKESLDTTTPQGQFCLTLFAALAQLERGLISERTKAALAERGRRDGERGGRMPYGYARTPAGGISVDPQAAALVRRVYALHLRGLSLREIAIRVQEMGLPGPRGGSVWRHTAVADILSNRQAYQGGLRGASSTHRWPAILGTGGRQRKA
jgi:DNA invertase Pin-like site-specific DNA recombinase